MKKSYGKGARLLAMFLSACLVWTSIPATVRAEENNLSRGGDVGLCPHHLTHTEECGYAEVSGGNACNYVCKICKVQALIDALPDAEDITEELYEETAAKLNEIDSVKAELSDEEMGQLDIAKYEAAAKKWWEIEGEMQTGEPVPTAATDKGWSLDEITCKLTISNNSGMADWSKNTTSSDVKKKVVSVEIQEGVTEIGDYAFEGCSSLTSIMISSSVTSISAKAFNASNGVKDCGKLEKIEVSQENKKYSSKDAVLFSYDKTELIRYPQAKQGGYGIPSSVTSIGELAFLYCEKLTDITIPSSVTSISRDAFNHCYGLTKIDVDGGNTSYSSTDGVLLSYDKTELIRYPEGKTGNYTIPEGVISIGEQAFYWCNDTLKSIMIPEGVTSIGERAFYYCVELTDITIPSSMEGIGNEAFAYCAWLGSPDGKITMIGGTPPTIGENNFPDTWLNNGGVKKIIYVPKGTYEIYKDKWGKYVNIINETTNAPKYYVKVNGGSRSDGYVAGDTVTITPTPPEGKTLKKWRVDSNNINDINISTNGEATFSMPASRVTITAVYDTYTVTVNGGSGSGEYAEGDPVSITATPPEGKTFTGWTVDSGKVNFANSGSATTTFVMPNGNVTVKANYGSSSPTVQKYTVTIINGVIVDSGKESGEYAKDETVTITATGFAGRQAGKQFLKWKVDSGNVTLDDEEAATTTFIMPAGAVTITAEYGDTPEPQPTPEPTPPPTAPQPDPIPEPSPSPAPEPSSSPSPASEQPPAPPAVQKYTVAVNNGSGSGDYEQGAIVTITANPPEAGKQFIGWNADSGTVAFADGKNPSTAFIMPAEPVIISAVYENVAEIPIPDSTPAVPDAGETSIKKDSEPRTGDNTSVEVYATLAMIAGMAYLRLCFADLTIGMSEETKRELVERLIKWAKRGGKIRKFAALALIFALLVYYHGIGKKMPVKWQEVYEA